MTLSENIFVSTVLLVAFLIVIALGFAIWMTLDVRDYCLEQGYPSGKVTITGDRYCLDTHGEIPSKVVKLK